MPINHANCAHPRTPAGRAACRKGSQTPVEAPKERDARNDTTRTRKARRDAFKALFQAPTIVREFVERCDALGFSMNAQSFNDSQHTIEVISSRGAARVTWEGEKIGWFTRVGHSSITRRATLEKVWDALGVASA